MANSGGSVTVRRSRVAADAALSRGVVGNQATRSGGAVHNWYGFVAIRGVDLVGNTAAVGGAISNDVGATVKVKRSTLVDNEASATGGAIFTAGGQTIVRDSAVQDNSATRGGGVHALLGTIEVHDSSVSLNTASEQGGGVALGSVNQSDARGNLEVGPTATFRHSDIDGNQGGGIHASAGTALDVKWVRVRDNTGSGIIAEDPGALVPFVEVEIRKSKVKRNTHHGVEVAGALIVKNSTISQNHRSGISLRGTARVATTTIANNHAAAWIGCGRTETRLVMRDVNVRDNEPNGGVYMACGTALIVGSRFVRNHDALEGGGAFYATASAAVEVVDTTFRNNRAQGPSGPVHGGAILNEAEMRLDGVTVTRNVSSGHGGGIHNSGVLEVINSTLSGNESRRRGGGLAASNTGMDQAPHTTLEHVTITNNSGGRRAGGLSATGGGLLAIFGSVVAGNAMNGQPDVDVSGSVSMTSGYNVYGGCCDFIWSATDLLDVADARLGPLRDNGGPTATHSLLASSPAIDLVPVSECRVWNDQRGVERPLGLGCDAGSFEF
ncbi:MAG: right-handed parallel beta-helix repeat-containing protein [bacterium]|nr:right-handed parallel beta-helix repeat-containing protein [bacterium]